MNTSGFSFSYEARIALLYALVWFIDLLDASLLNVALPAIAQAFGVPVVDAEWTIIGFLLALTLAIPVSSWLGNTFGLKRVFLSSQLVYTASSLACGVAPSLSWLIVFRALQGVAGGLLIPVGMTILIKSIAPTLWPLYTSRINTVTLIAPAVGPLIAGYVTALFGWQWLFLGKLPLLLATLLLSYWWVDSDDSPTTVSVFDWRGFLLLTLSLATLFIALSEIGRPYLSVYTLILLGAISSIAVLWFVAVESRAANPLITLDIFRSRLFTFGNLVQCAANSIFLGASFITALYLQVGLRLDIVTVGWILAAITPGMLCMLPLISRYYNRYGPRYFIISGLCVLSLTMVSLIFVSATTSPFLIALIIFCEGAASVSIQTPNVIAIFSDIPASLKSDGSALYALGKQLSASFGVAFSTMILSVGMRVMRVEYLESAPSAITLPIFSMIFFFLGLIPLLALPLCTVYRKKELQSY